MDLTLDTGIAAAVQFAGARDQLLYVGIDPGAEGAVALLVGNKSFVADIPTLKVKRAGGSKTEFQLTAIAAAFRRLRPVRALVRVALEEAQVQVRGQGANAYTGFRVGVGFGLWLLALALLELPCERYAPASWKRAVGLLGKDKEAARLKALGMFPGAPLGRKKDHNRAEAMLLAEHHRRRLTGGA